MKQQALFTVVISVDDDEKTIKEVKVVPYQDAEKYLPHNFIEYVCHHTGMFLRESFITLKEGTEEEE